MNVFILVTLGAIFCHDISRALAQVKAPMTQEAGDCSVNIAGSGNSASLVCNNLDPKVAEQVQAILNSTQRNEIATKDISRKLDLILKEISKRPTPRRIPSDKRAEIVATLARRPAKISVSAILHDAEAYQFAEEWYDAFKAAGWTMMDDRVRVFTIVGKPESGILIRLHGETVPPGRPVATPRNTPAGLIVESLEKLKIPQVWVQRYPDMPQDQLSFEVSERPKN